jgi:hypothetical protein
MLINLGYEVVLAVVFLSFKVIRMETLLETGPAEDLR